MLRFARNFWKAWNMVCPQCEGQLSDVQETRLTACQRCEPEAFPHFGLRFHCKATPRGTSPVGAAAPPVAVTVTLDDVLLA